MPEPQMDIQSLDARVTDLEVLYTHQQQTLQQLNGVLVDNTRGVDALTKRVSQLTEAVRQVRQALDDLRQED